MTQFLNTPIDKSLSTADVWTDIDLSSDIPSYATGAVFQIINTDAGGDHTFGLRKNGSSDDRCKSIDPDAQVFMIVGVDGNQICEGKQNSNYVDFYLVGYTESDAILFTNGYDKSQTTTGVWTDLDLSSELPAGSVAAIFEVYNNWLSPQSWGLRKKGSTDNRYDDLGGLYHVYFITGIDANRKCQFKIENTDIDFFLLGYLKSGTAETNGVNRSLGSTGSYIDIAESGAPSGTTGAFVEFDTSTLSSAFGARKNGMSWDKYYLPPAKKSMILVGLDESKKWEAKIATLNHDFYRLGYFAATVEWLSGYSYRKKGAVNATTAGAQTNYQLKLVVGESSGASGEDVDCGNNCLDFPNDIRFTKEDGTTKHDYWIDTSSLTGTTPNRKVDVWIEVASIPASGSVDFYMYYGKSGDGGESEGDDTFGFFDDFECPETLQLIKTTKENVHLSTDYCMDPNMCMLHDGSWFVVFREGSVHTYSSSGKARFVTSSNKGESWSSPSTIYDTANKDDRQPNVFEFQEGGVWTILVAWTITIANPIDDNCEAVKVIKSTNGGTSWGTPVTVTTGDDMRVTGNPIQMANGNILLPLTAYVTGKKRNKVAISDDDGVNWTIYNASNHYTDGRCNELAVVEYEAGKLLGIARNQAGSYFNKITSTNYGITWSSPVLTNVPSPKDRPHLILLQSGDIALTYAHTNDDYRIVRSSDNGVSWDLDNYSSVYYELGIAAFSGYPASIEYEENKVFSIFEIQASSSDEDIYGNKINTVDVKWDVEGAISVSNGVVHLDNDDWITGKTAFGNGYCYESRAKANEQDTCFILACQTHNVWNDDIIIIGNSDLYPDDFDRFFLDFWKAASQNTVSLDNWNDFRDVYYHYCIKKISNSKVIMEQELNSSTYTNSTYITTENLKLALRVWDSSQESQLDVDFALVRKYADPEPTWGTWGGAAVALAGTISVSSTVSGALTFIGDYEDFTTFTEVDVGANRIQKTAYHIDHLSYRNETTYLYKDYGAAHFGDFEHRIKVRTPVTPDDYGYGCVWALTNDLGDMQTLRDANKSYINIFLYRVGSNLITYLRETHNGTTYQDTNTVALHTDWRYIKIVKAGTSLNAYIYSDSSYSTLVDTLTLTMHVDGSYKYLFGCNSLNDSNTHSMATDIENFDLSDATVALAGTISAISTVSGALNVSKKLSGAITSTSALTGILSIQDLAGTISAVSTVSGALHAKLALAGTISAISSVAGTLKRAIGLEAAVSPPIVGTTFDIAVAKGTSEEGVSIGAEFKCGNMLLTDLYLKTPQLATANKTAKLELLTQRDNIIYSTGDLDASSVLEYSRHNLTRSLRSPTEYKITTDANVSDVRIFNIEIRGVRGYEIIAATSSVSGSLTKTSALSGTISATSSVSGALRKGVKLAGAITASSSLQAALSIPVFAESRGYYYAKIGSTIFRNLNKASFRITEELNKIPSFEFEISNSAGNRAAITAGITDILRIYHRHDGSDTLMFTGIINGDAIEYLSLERIRLVGYASYIDLNWRFHQHLNSEDAEDVGKCFVYHGSYTDRTAQANSDPINDVTITFSSINDAIYIGQTETFFGMQVKYSTKGVQAANTTVVWEYSEGSSVWSTLDVLDETRQFTQDTGTYYITIPHKPSDWAKETVNSVKKFWIRARLTAGSYSTQPKLDRIKMMNIDPYRVYYFDTAANTIMDEVLDGTGYSMDVTDTCPSDTISIVAEYETKLRMIAGVANALTWDDSGDKKAYQWWVDTSKKVHFKQKRGSILGDITKELTILNNVQDYFNLSNRLHFLGNYDGLNQLRAVIENTDSQDTHEIRELAVPEERYNNYIPLKEAAQKAMTYTKVPLQKIVATVTTKYWIDEGFEVGDTVTLHHDRWNVDETAFQIVRADIGPRVTNLDMGISQEHLDGLKAGLQRQLDISGIRMHGSTSLLQFGPETMNYQRVDSSEVYSSKLKFEIPSDARYIHKILVSWKLGNYRADVSGGEESEGHDHTAFAGAGGAHEHGGFAGAGGAHDSSVLDGGLHTPTELGKAHTHNVEGVVPFNLEADWGYLPTSKTVSYGNAHSHTNPATGWGGSHSHSVGSTGGPSSTQQVAYQWTPGSSCTSGSCIVSLSGIYVASSGHTHSNPTTGASGQHYHGQAGTGSGGGHDHTLTVATANTRGYIWDVDLDYVQWTSEADSPAHAHTINEVPNHPHTAVAIAAHVNHVIGTQIAHGNHSIVTQAAAMIDIALGIVEIAGGTVMQLTVNGEDVTTVDGDGTDIVITGFCNSGANTVEIAPIVGSNVKGGATLEARGIIFIESSKF